MKKYRSHKIVEAGLIASVQRTGIRSLVVTLDNGETVRVDGGPMVFKEDSEIPGGYLVRYSPDGYVSWSPAEVFEQGYAEVLSEPHKSERSFG